MNEMAYVFQAWLPQVVWQQVDAPQYRKGFITVTILSVALIATTCGIFSIQKSEVKCHRYVRTIHKASGDTGLLTIVYRLDRKHSEEPTETEPSTDGTV